MKYWFVFLALFTIGAAPLNWASTARQLPSGAVVLGNPAARVKFVEYLSYSCSHCADFTAASKIALKRDFVARGVVSVEIRNAVRDRYDFAAALLARCGGPRRFFGNTEALMAAQSRWLEQSSVFDRSNAEKMSKMPINTSLKLIVNNTPLIAIMKARGLTSTQINACVVSKVDQDKIVAMTSEAWNVRKISGTPAFMINDQLVPEAVTWANLEPQLKAAVAAR